MLLVANCPSEDVFIDFMVEKLSGLDL